VLAELEQLERSLDDERGARRAPPDVSWRAADAGDAQTTRARRLFPSPHRALAQRRSRVVGQFDGVRTLISAWNASVPTTQAGTSVHGAKPTKTKKIPPRVCLKNHHAKSSAPCC
jgi:hypothetical protein